MEESGNNYYEYTAGLGLLREYLGIGRLYCSEDSEYLVETLTWISKAILNAGTKDLLTLINIVFDKYEYGADLIRNGLAPQLYEEVVGKVYVDDEEVEGEPYGHHDTPEDIFILSWTDFMSSLCTYLKILYDSLLNPVVPKDCGCPCGHGETYEDWENYTSGVVPEDDNTSIDFDYSMTNPYDGTNDCCCGYRIK